MRKQGCADRPPTCIFAYEQAIKVRPFLPAPKREIECEGSVTQQATLLRSHKDFGRTRAFGKQFREAIHTKGRLSAFKPGVLLDQHVKLASVCELRPPDHVLCVVTLR